MPRKPKALLAVLAILLFGAAACVPAPAKSWDGIKLVSKVQAERICAAKTGGSLEAYPDYIHIPAKKVVLTATTITMWLYGKTKAITYARFPSTGPAQGYPPIDIASDVRYHNANLIEGDNVAQFLQCGPGKRGGRNYGPVVLAVTGD